MHNVSVIIPGCFCAEQSIFIYSYEIISALVITQQPLMVLSVTLFETSPSRPRELSEHDESAAATCVDPLEATPPSAAAAAAAEKGPEHRGFAFHARSCPCTRKSSGGGDAEDGRARSSHSPSPQRRWRRRQRRRAPPPLARKASPGKQRRRRRRWRKPPRPDTPLPAVAAS